MQIKYLHVPFEKKIFNSKPKNILIFFWLFRIGICIKKLKIFPIKTNVIHNFSLHGPNMKSLKIRCLLSLKHRKSLPKNYQLEM